MKQYEPIETEDGYPAHVPWYWRSLDLEQLTRDYPPPPDYFRTTARMSRDELRALDLLGLDPDADFDAVKKAWRSKAKEVHPDVRPGDKDAAEQFQKLQLAYEVLRQAEERREWRG